MKLLKIISITTLLVSAACAHTLMRETVAMKTSDKTAHICLAGNEVKEGDRVTLFKKDCPSGGGSDSAALCNKWRIGEGTVTKLLNNHYSEVVFDSGVEFDEGDIVETQKVVSINKKSKQ